VIKSTNIIVITREVVPEVINNT